MGGYDSGAQGVSADGSVVTFLRGHTPNREGWVANPTSDPRGAERAVWAVSVRGGRPWRVVRAVSYALSPDGKWVAYARDGQIYRAPVNPGLLPPEGVDDAPPLFRAFGQNGDPVWSPDGRHIAYFTIANIAEYVQHNVLPNPDAAVHDGGFWNRDEAGQERDPEQEETEEERTLRFNLWSVDIEQGEHRLIVTFEPVDTFVNHLLPFFDQYALSHRIWSPDSDAIVLPMTSGGDEGNERADIYVVPMLRRGGPPRPIAEGTMAFWSQC